MFTKDVDDDGNYDSDGDSIGSHRRLALTMMTKDDTLLPNLKLLLSTSDYLRLLKTTLECRI